MINLILDYYTKVLFSNILKVAFLLPVRKKRLMFISFNGKQYSCNPKYISEYIEHSENFKGCKIVWAFQDPEKFRFLAERGIEVIKHRSLRYLYYRLTSGVYVTNMGEMPTLPTRPSQLYINTWHGGGGYKLCGFRNAVKHHDIYYAKKMANSFSRATHFISTSAIGTRDVIRESFLFKGNILEIGQPRNDVFWIDGTEFKKRVFDYYKLPIDTKICLYAPTYREIGKLYDAHLDFVALKEHLHKRFGGNWVVLYRSHQFLDNLEIKNNVISATAYPDMQELLVAADFLISDYSSSIWDYSFTYKPSLLFTPDLKAYQGDRDFYTPIKTWGFPIACNNAEVVSIIDNFDLDIHRKNMEKHHMIYGSFEDGHATEKVCKLIHTHIYRD